MSKERVSYLQILLLTHVVISSGVFIVFLPSIGNARAEAILHNLRPPSITHYANPHRQQYAMGYLNPDFPLKQKNPAYLKPAPLPGDDIFQIEASDAIDGIKYSQPDIAYSLFNSNSGIKVPSSAFLKHKLIKTPAQNPSSTNFQEQTSETLHDSEKNPLKTMRDIRFLDSAVDEGTPLSVADGNSNYKQGNKNLENVFQTHNYDTETTNVYLQSKNNFTDGSDNLVSVSSDAILSYEVPASEFNDSNVENTSVKLGTDIVNDMPSPTHSNTNSSADTSVPKTLLPTSTQNSVQSNTHVYIDYINQTNITDSNMKQNIYGPTSIFPSISSEDNVTNSLPSTDFEKKLSSGTVAGIVIAVLVSVTLLSSAVIYLLYRKFNGKCTSVVESKFNTDNCGYLDDSLRSSIYLNNHIELPKESSEEMTSLDNDSFLNSLETMTIQNYWADNSKNTKV